MKRYVLIIILCICLIGCSQESKVSDVQYGDELDLSELMDSLSLKDQSVKAWMMDSLTRAYEFNKDLPLDKSLKPILRKDLSNMKIV